MLTNEYVAQDTADHDPRVDERARDIRCERDISTLAATLRIDIESAAGKGDTVQQFADVLWRLRRQLLGGSAQGMAQQVCDDWGPEAVLRALLRAYTEPQVYVDQVEHE